MKKQDRIFDRKLFSKLVKDRGMKLVFIAGKLKVSLQSVSFWNVGKCDPTIDHIKELGALFGVPWQDFLLK